MTVPGGNMVAEALVVDGASLSVSNEWMVGSNTSRDAYIGAPMRLRSDEDIALLADKENNVMVPGAGGVQVSTLGGTEILASRIAMATAWNEDARVTTAGGAVRTGARRARRLFGGGGSSTGAGLRRCCNAGAGIASGSAQSDAAPAALPRLDAGAA